LSIILSKITRYGFAVAAFHTPHNRPSHFFSTCFGESILILVFLNLVALTILAKASGVRSEAGVSHKSLANIIFSISV
jgi:hypothetical protein